MKNEVEHLARKLVSKLVEGEPGNYDEIASELAFNGMFVDGRDVYPRKNWKAVVSRAEAGGKDWEAEANEKADKFEEIMAKHGFELGSVGGNPKNVDYNSGSDGAENYFAFWGNPHHI